MLSLAVPFCGRHGGISLKRSETGYVGPMHLDYFKLVMLILMALGGKEANELFSFSWAGRW